MTDSELRPDAGSGEAARLLALVDRLEVLLEENDLAELEVESGPTRVILRRADIVATMTSSCWDSSIAWRPCWTART